jgi:hypothetical protein
VIDVRRRLVKALHTSATLPALREELVLVLCDLETDNAPTLRSITADAYGREDAPDTEPDSAPPTPVESAMGQEFGP